MRYFLLATSAPPTIFSHAPLGTYTHSSPPSALDWPAQACLLVPQSFLPALAIPAHFSMLPLSSLAANAFEPAVARPTASKLAMAERITKSVWFIVRFSLALSGYSL